MEEIMGSVKRLDDPAFKNAITPLPIMTGKSIKVVRLLYNPSACLWIQKRPCDFSPVEEKYSSNREFHEIVLPNPSLISIPYAAINREQVTLRVSVK